MQVNLQRFLFTQNRCKHYVKEIKNVFKDILERSKQRKTCEGYMICTLLCICYNSQNIYYWCSIAATNAMFGMKWGLLKESGFIQQEA